MYPMRRVLIVFALLGACTAVALTQGEARRTAEPSATEAFDSRTVASRLDFPWEITYGPDNRLWISERRARRVVRIDPTTGTLQPAVTIDEAHQSVTQDGLLGMALHPDLLRGRNTDFVYVAFTYDDAPGPKISRAMAVRRYTYDPMTETLGAPVDILTGLPAWNQHNSGRLIFGPDNTLYLTIGDSASLFGLNRCNTNLAQELPTQGEIDARDYTKYRGKILRFNPDGSIPATNPVLNGVRSHIYSYGHRNSEGLVFGPNGVLYETEHGPSSDDELNLIEAGKNYGWPLVAGYRDDKMYVFASWPKSSPQPCTSLYSISIDEPPSSVPTQKETAWNHPDFRPPLATLFTVDPPYSFRRQGNATVAPGSVDIYTSRTIPGWATSILIPGMKGRVYRLKLAADGRTTTGLPVEYFAATQRYRDLAISPGGDTIFLVTDGGDVIERKYRVNATR